jgi:hypothetical protein
MGFVPPVRDVRLMRQTDQSRICRIHDPALCRIKKYGISDAKNNGRFMGTTSNLQLSESATKEWYAGCSLDS